MRQKKLAFVLLLALLGMFAAPAVAGIQLSVNIAPPPITVFDQPACPGDGYIWVPGYYQYGDYGYYWVPGQWVVPPGVGLLWTPGYWGFAGGTYTWNAGYWGPTVGFYGGINYGNGYFGTGFTGGRWEGNKFLHNTVISNVDRKNVHNTYADSSVVKKVTTPNHAFNGKGGIETKPSPAEAAASKAPHQTPTPVQATHAQEANDNHLAAHGTPRK